MYVSDWCVLRYAVTVEEYILISLKAYAHNLVSWYAADLCYRVEIVKSNQICEIEQHCKGDWLIGCSDTFVLLILVSICCVVNEN